MKKLIVLLSIVALGSCRNSTGPVANIPTTQGINGSYLYHHTIPNMYGVDSIAYDERVDFPESLRAANGFVAVYTPMNGFAPSQVPFSFLTDGDLVKGQVQQCFKSPLPIRSHQNFPAAANTVSVPTKANGFEADGSVAMRSEYLGQETLVVAGGEYDCSKVRYDVVVHAASGRAEGALTMNRTTQYFWYSPAIGFFVREQEVAVDSTESGTQTRTDYTRQLTSFSH